jgi:hypothetical protein
MNRDIKAEYIRLFSLEITDFTRIMLAKLKGLETKPLEQLVDDCAKRIYDISNADFEDNSNVYHGKENGSPF